MTRHLGSIIVAAALVGALAGCGGTAAKAQVGATCDQFGSTPNIEQTAKIAVGDQLDISLCSNPTTGFGWEKPEIADATLVSLVDSTYHGPGATLPVVGAGGGQVMTVKGVAAGTTSMLVKYSRPWAGGEKGVWTYRLTLTVGS